jgi:hypothetical protein
MPPDSAYSLRLHKAMKRLLEILEETKTKRAPGRGARATGRKSVVSGTLVGGCP